MKAFARTVSFFFTLVALAGCASTEFTQQSPLLNEPMARPNQIWVYSFGSTPADIPAGSPIRGVVSAPGTSPTAEQLQTGRRLGALVAHDLAADIQAMGLSAAQTGPDSFPQTGDAIIRGYLVSVEDGGPVKRLVIGFGYGSSEMETLVEGYSVTSQGLHSLGWGAVRSSGARTPGIVLPVATAIVTGNPIGLIVGSGVRIYGEVSGRNTLEARAQATADKIGDQLRMRFQQRGWINAQPAKADVTWKTVGSSVGAVGGNVLYLPAKLLYGTLGGIAGSTGYALTGGDQRVADTIWRCSLGGDYVITPGMVTGDEPLHFAGPASNPQ